MTEDEMVGWHQLLNGHEFGWTPGVTPKTLAEVSREIIDGVDFVVNPRCEGKPTKKPSSIIAFGEGGEVKIIRE